MLPGDTYYEITLKGVSYGVGQCTQALQSAVNSIIIRRQIRSLIYTVAYTSTKEDHSTSGYKNKHSEYTLQHHINSFLHLSRQFGVKL